MKTISFLLKPASGSCNMRCRYCFYEDVSSHRETHDLGRMSKETASSLIDWAFSSLDDDATVTFAFQGGEPTLAGLDFFRDFVKKVNETRKSGQRVSFSLQTNGYSLSEEWASFFKENNFLIGISVDGNLTQHNRNRIDRKGEGTYLRIIENLKTLKKYGVDYNALCVVTGKTDPVKAYSSLKREGFRFLQFIPCLDPYEEERGGRDFSLTAETYASFLTASFDLWYRDWKNGKYISVRLFDDYVHLLMGEAPSSCSVLGRCGGYMVVEADGSIYPCDFYALDQWCLGNICTDSFPEMEKKRKELGFIQWSCRLPEECRTCRWVMLCRNGCRRDRLPLEDGQLDRNFYCQAYRAFFTARGPRLEQAVRLILSRRSPYGYTK